MRQSIFIAGIVVIVVGVLLVGASFTLNTQATTVPDPRTGEFLTFSATVLFSGTVTLAWSGADQSFRFTINQCADAACSPGAAVASGGGASGSVSFTVTGGVTYVVEALGNTLAVPVTLTFSGLTPLLLIGIVVAIAGAGVAFLGYVKKPKPRPAPRPVAARPTERFPPLARQEESGTTHVAPTPSAAAPSPEPSGPVFFQPTGPEELYGANAPAAAPAPAAGERPWTKCGKCGTMNEPWLHNCRFCKRPLESTGG